MPLNTKQYRNNSARSPMRSLPKQQTWHSGARVLQEARENAARFGERYNIPVRVDFVGWEDIRPHTAVIANTGSGPEAVIGWGDDPHIYSDKLLDLSDIADYLGRRYGGWAYLAPKYGTQHGTDTWIGIPFGGSAGTIVYRASSVREAGFDRIPDDHQGFLRLCQGLKRSNKPAGFALGNAVGDGNGFANWLLWSHNASVVDEEGKVCINSRETIEALDYLRQLYPTFAPGTLSWLDPSNNRAYSAQEVHLTANGVSLYFTLKKDPQTAAIARDTEHAPLPKGRRASTAASRHRAERHGVPPCPLPERGQGVHSLHAGSR